LFENSNCGLEFLDPLDERNPTFHGDSDHVMDEGISGR
jgi:hypothetical protein